MTRFAFVSENTSYPSFGNLLDDISFSTLIGDLSATYGDNNSVVIKGYWGETDTSKKLIIDINGTTYEVDMTNVIGQNFVITMTEACYGEKPSDITIYHQDYESAARTISVNYPISASAADVELDCDGNAHTISPVVTVPESDYTLKYGTSYGGISLDELTYTMGTHPIYYSVSAPGYTTYKGKATLRINPVSHTVSFTVNNSDMGSVGVRSVVYSEDLETRDNGAFALPDGWTNDGTNPWVVANHTLKSGNGGKHGTTSTIKATYNFTNPGTISFSYRISSEGGWDKGYFSIDDVTKIDGISGSFEETFTANVDAGTHTFKWWYYKDGSGNNGEDAFFIDNIVIYGFRTDITNTTCITGDEFELLAIPKEGCHLVRWDDNSTDENRVVTIDRDMTITAYFNNANVPEVTLTDGQGVTALDTYKEQEIWVNYTRSFTEGKTSTVCLPFAYTKKTGDGSFYAFTNIEKNGSGEYVATMTEPGVSTLTANTPYLYMPIATGNVDFSGAYTIPASLTAGSTTSNGWTFKGTYETITWTTAPTGIYGFSGVNTDGISQGQFVKAGANFYINPMRCYLEYKSGSEDYAGARGMKRAEQLPETIKVRLVSASGEVTAIGSLQTKTGEVTLDGDTWHSLDGRRLKGKPATKGVYINNNNKVIIK